MATTRSTNTLGFIVAGAIAGMIAGAAMAMFSMIASVTYLGIGFFTPLYAIAAPLVGQGTLLTALKEGPFYFVLGPAILGLVIHMMWAALYGVIFGLIARGLHLIGVVAVIGGMVYGVLIMLLMNFIAMPIIGAPNLLAQGWPSFIIEHLMFGLVVGLWPVLRPRDFGSLQQLREAVLDLAQKNGVFKRGDYLIFD